MKDKESELKQAEQRLHDEFERLRRQNAEEKRQLDDKKRQLVSYLPRWLQQEDFVSSCSDVHAAGNAYS